MAITPEMPASTVIELLRMLDVEAIVVWLDGGWGVDALLGHQSRKHRDVDVIVREADVPKALQILGRRSLSFKEGSVPNSFVLADGAGLEVDVHAVVFDQGGNGIYRQDGGGGIRHPQPLRARPRPAVQRDRRDPG